MTDHNDLLRFAASLADILGQGKQRQLGTTGNWMTCCPAHTDASPSLGIYVDEQIRLVCYANCTQEAILAGCLERGVREIPQATKFKGGAAGVTVNKLAHEDKPDPEWFLQTFQRIPDHVYLYQNPSGKTAFCVIRIDENPPEVTRKIVKPVCSVRPKAGGKDFWISQGYPSSLSRPLYGLPDLTGRPDDPVLLVEGEKAADRARLLLPDYVVMTWAGGAAAIKQSDWRPLASRDVTLWPDNDEPGIRAMREIASVIGKGKYAAKSVRLVFEEFQDEFPKGFDLGDTYREDYTPIPYLLENARVLDPSKLPDTPVTMDDEELEAKLKVFLDKYVACHLGKDHLYIDLTNSSPHTSNPIPYRQLSPFTLDQAEVDTFLDINPQTGKKSLRKFIDVFLQSNKKRWVDGYVYDPSTTNAVIQMGNQLRLNLYCGMAHPPKKCDPALYQKFIDHIYASCSNLTEANYLLDWLASKIQRPEIMLGTMVILSGRQGCGKTIICDIIRAILGRHNAVKIGMSDLTGSFNSQYANKLFIDVEEYNPGNSKILRDLREKVKNLVTSESMIVNTKGLPAYENPCYHNIIATTNSQVPEDISFDNRRMTFLRFDNPNLKTDGRVISDNEYFAPLYALKASPEALSGLCQYLTDREISLGKVTKPLDTEMTEEAMTFVDDPMLAFLKSVAETGVLPLLDTVPSNEGNTYPMERWPVQAIALPRSYLNQIFRDWCQEFRREIFEPAMASRMLLRALPKTAKGISDDFNIDKTRRWEMVGRWQKDELSEIRDRAICLPSLDELRYLIDKMAGTPIKWSPISVDVVAEASKVVDFPTKKPMEEGTEF